MSKSPQVKLKRPYQAKAIAECVAALPKHKRVLLHAFMGSGKSYMALEIAKRIAKLHNRQVLVLADRSALLDQLAGDDAYPAFEAEFGKGCVVSRQSLDNRIRETPRKVLIIIDECHRSAGYNYRAIIKAHKNAWVLGLTATPERLDKRPLFSGQKGRQKPVFEHRVMIPGVLELAAMKPPVVLIPDHYTSEFDLRGFGKLKRKGWEIDKKDAEAKLTPLIGRMVDHYKAYKGQTIVFAISIAHAASIEAQFKAAGVSVAMAHSKMSEAHDNIERFKSGALEVLVTVDMVSEGFDMPALANVILARPTLSRAKYIQMIGRVMRVAPGKKTAVVLDHAGNFHHHGKVEADYDYLTGKQRFVSAKVCLKCGFVNKVTALKCEKCGFSMVGVLESKTAVERKLIELDENLRKTEEVERQEAEFVAEVRRKQAAVEALINVERVEGPALFGKRIGVPSGTLSAILTVFRRNPHHKLSCKGEQVAAKAGSSALTRSTLTSKQRDLIVAWAPAYLAQMDEHQSEQAQAKALDLTKNAISRVRHGEIPVELLGFGTGKRAMYLNAKYPRKGK